MLGAMPIEEEDRRRLGQLVAARRHELRLTKEAAARAGEMSSITWKRVEDGLTVRDVSYTGVERALNWKLGSCLRNLTARAEPEIAGTGGTGPGAVPAAASDEAAAAFGRAMRGITELDIDEDDRAKVISDVTDLYRHMLTAGRAHPASQHD